MTTAIEFRPTSVRSRAMLRGDLGLPEAEVMTMAITALLGSTDAPWDTELTFEEISAWARDGNPDINEQYKCEIKAGSESFVASGVFALLDAGYLNRTDRDGVAYFKVTDKLTAMMRRFAK